MDLKTRFKFTIKSVQQGLKRKELRNILIFYLIIAIVTPNFDEFFSYYLGFGILKSSLKDTLVFLGILSITFIYELKFTDSPIRSLIICAFAAKLISSILSLLLALGITFGLSRYWFVCI